MDRDKRQQLSQDKWVNKGCKGTVEAATGLILLPRLSINSVKRGISRDGQPRTKSIRNNCNCLTTRCDA